MPGNPDESGCDWKNVKWNKTQAFLKGIPGYPDCKIWIAYQFRTCPNNPKLIQVNIVGICTDWWVLGWWTDCDELSDYLTSGDEAEKAKKLDWLEKELYYCVSKKLFEESCAEMGQVPCNAENEPDPDVPLPFQVFYSKGSCSAKILLHIGHNEHISKVYDFVTCGKKTSCCKQWYSFCYNQAGNLISKTNIENAVTNCTNYPTSEDISKILKRYEKAGLPVFYWQVHRCVSSCSDFR